MKEEAAGLGAGAGGLGFTISSFHAASPPAIVLFTCCLSCSRSPYCENEY